MLPSAFPTSQRILCLSMMMLCLSLSRFASASTRRNGAAGFATAFVHHGPSRISRQASYINNRQTVAYSSVSDEDQLTESGYKRPTVQWYPGHIAKAERQLSETLKAVDVVVEVRDARACKATAHPKVGEWCAGRPRIVVLTHLDMIPRNAVSSWKMAYDKLGAERWDDAPVNTQVANQAQQARDIRFSYGDPTPVNKNKKPRKEEGWEKRPKIVTPVEQVMFINAKQGEGIHALQRAIFKAGAHVQERRERRGLKTRSLRVGIIGYPNVGKSALINKILGRRRARTANTPGVTRSLQWIRVRTDDFKTSNKEFELLDSPGIIPAKMVDQSDALLLAACNCIGEAAYDNQAVAAYLCEWLKTIHVMEKQHLAAPEWREKVKERYKFDPMKPNEETGELLTGEDMLFLVADNTCQGDPEDASRKILGDFRAGRMGPVSLQLAPETEEDDGQLAVPIGTSRVNDKEYVSFSEQREQEQQERARMAVETAKERGLELPPIVENPDKVDDGDIGKGMFDGW